MAPHFHHKLAMISSWTFGLNLNEMKKGHFAWNLHFFNIGSHILNEFFPVFSKKKEKILLSTFFLFQLKKTRKKQETVVQTLRFSILQLLSLFDTYPCINRNVIFFSALVPKISQSNMANSVDRIWGTLLLLWHQEWVTQYCFLFVSLMIQFTLYTTESKLLK